MAVPDALLRPRVALATSWDGSSVYECGLPLWCHRAQHIAERIGPLAQLVIIAPRQSPECDSARTFWDPNFELAIHVYVRRASNGTWVGMPPRARAQSYLHKLMALALHRTFDLVFFSDIDMDLDTPGRHQFDTRLWWRSIRALMSSHYQFVASPDFASPINAGSWLLKPTARLHRRAIRLLCVDEWSARDGFAHTGRPREALGSAIAHLAAGAGALPGRVAATLHGTVMMRNNTWAFIGGNLDQGILTHLMFVAASRLAPPVGTWAAFGGNASQWRPVHFWGPAKPWMELASTADYLERVAPSISLRLSRCARELKRRKGTMQYVEHNWADGRGRQRYGSKSVGHAPVLPVASIARSFSA